MGKKNNIREIRKILNKNREKLEIVIPGQVYRTLQVAYGGSHQPPSQGQINRDARYLSEVLNLR